MNKGTGSGGTNTTHNGIAYEKLTSNETMLLSEGYIKECDYLKKVFENEKDFRPDWDAQNGFDVYGADFLFEKKQPYLLEINQRASLIPNVIPGMLSVVLDDKEIGFTKIL